MDSISFLVTGPEASLMAWQQDAMKSIELFDRRGQTVRCRVHGVDFLDLDSPHWGQRREPEEMQRQLDFAVDLAKKHDVTVQRLDGAGDSEMHPVLYLASHGMKWA